MSLRLAMVALPVALALPAALAACGPSFVVDGKVVTCADKQPIEGASVTASFSGGSNATEIGGDQERTKRSGEFHIGAMNIPKDATAKVRIERDGFEPTDVVYSGSPDGEQTVCLERKK